MYTKTVTVIECYEVKNEKTPKTKAALTKLTGLCCITFYIALYFMNMYE